MLVLLSELNKKFLALRYVPDIELSQIAWVAGRYYQAGTELLGILEDSIGTPTHGDDSYRRDAMVGACTQRLAITASILCLWSQGSAMAQRSSIQRGETLVMQHCAMCHGTGSSETTPNPMARSFRDIVRNRPIDSLEEPLRNGALFGHPLMPGFALSPRDAHAIVRYLRSIQSR
jgi:hypothetical protein